MGLSSHHLLPTLAWVSKHPAGALYYWENGIKLQSPSWAFQWTESTWSVDQIKKRINFSYIAKSNSTVLALSRRKPCWHSLISLSPSFSKNNMVGMVEKKESMANHGWIENNDKIVYIFLPKFLSWKWMLLLKYVNQRRNKYTPCPQFLVESHNLIISARVWLSLRH